MINKIMEEAKEIAIHFRLGEYVVGSQKLPDFMKRVIDVSLYDMSELEVLADLTQLSSLILECQGKRDWLGVADYLEYEMCSVLRQKVRKSA